MLPSFFLRVWITSHPSYHWLDRAPRLHPCPPWSSRQALTQTCDAALECERRYIGHFRQAQGSQAVLVSKLLDHKENRLQEHVPIDVIYFKSRQVIGIKDVFCWFFFFLVCKWAPKGHQSGCHAPDRTCPLPDGGVWTQPSTDPTGPSCLSYWNQHQLCKCSDMGLKTNKKQEINKANKSSQEHFSSTRLLG